MSAGRKPPGSENNYCRKFRKRDYGTDISGWSQLIWKCPNCGEEINGVFNDKGEITKECPHCTNLMSVAKETRRCIAIRNYGLRRDEAV